jgi:uncharacterized protein YqjF (DUF2071 family)
MRFLTAEWRNLVMLNFVVEPAILRPLVPAGTELDAWRGLTFVSLVGFLFANTRVLGIPIPGHRTFEEINLRFYVRRGVNGELRRAVTFIRELVPRTAIAFTARALYNEPYRVAPMRHRFGAPRADGMPARVEYEWKSGAEWTTIDCTATGPAIPALSDSQEEFITEHYWGYTRQRNGSTIEYRVDHPPWRVASIEAPVITGELERTYGAVFASILRAPPASAFLADGSAVTVFAPAPINP